MVVRTGSDRVKHSAQDGARVARVVGRSLDDAGDGRTARGVRVPTPARYGPPRRRRRRVARRGGAPDTTRRPTPHSPRPWRSRRRSTTICTSATTPSACCATSASRRAAPDHQNTFAIAVAGRGFDARHLHGIRRPAARLGVRVLRQLHRRVPDRRADGEARVRHAPRRHVGRVANDGDRHDLPVLRRRLHAHAARQATRNREGDVAARQGDHARQSLHQGALRLAVRPERKSETAPSDNGRA